MFNYDENQERADYALVNSGSAAELEEQFFQLLKQMNRQ